jgi:Fe-S cluster assembly protein SufD
VVVHRDAQKIEAHQSNPNLLLSARGEVDTKPELQIFADDVKCSHGATVGQLDAQALFYLRSRGLDEATATGVLTFGFAEAAIARLGFPAMRSHLEQLLIERLPAAQAVAKEMTSG